MKNELEFKGQLTIEMLKKEGLKVTTEEAEKILVFLRELANIVVTTYFKNDDPNNKENNIYPKKGKVKNKPVINYCKPCIIINTELQT